MRPLFNSTNCPRIIRSFLQLKGRNYGRAERQRTQGGPPGSSLCHYCCSIQAASLHKRPLAAQEETTAYKLQSGRGVPLLQSVVMKRRIKHNQGIIEEGSMD